MTSPQEATSIAIRRSTAEYTPANKRTDNCKGCGFMKYSVRDPDTAYERQTMHCTRGDFPVSHGSICDAWKASK